MNKIAVYDAENRLSINSFNNGNNDFETRYFYSGDSMLAKVEKWDDTVLLGTLDKMDEVRFVRAGFLPVQERDENNTITRAYTWGLNKGGGIGGLLNLKQDGNDYSYLYDGKGNVMVVLDSGQNVVASYRYDAFGNLLKNEGALEQPFMFSTKRHDKQTGLSYYGYRFYSPTIGRWMSRDPLGEAGGINLYGFVGNNAVNYIDSYGLIAVADDVAVIGLVTLSTMTVAYLESPAGQQMLRNAYKSAEDIIQEIKDEYDKRLKESKCETRVPWQGPGKKYDPNEPPDPKKPWWKKAVWAAGQLRKLMKGWPN